VSHGFDDQGAKFDAQGNLKNWWTDADLAAFNQRTGLVTSQFDEYTVLDSVHVQGKLTLGENIGDLGGLNIAYAALKKSMEGKPRPPLIDGFTPEQRFFLAWAQIWRQNITPQAQRQRILTDSHSPGRWRANGMPELHKLIPALSGLMARGRRVAIVTDGRMSGASGKVPSAIHLTPEAAADGPISRLRDGDIIRLDARAGVLEAQVDAATFQAREIIKPDLTDTTFGVGRELFTRLREGATAADEGASIL
jgi:hypothetical protein